MVAFVFGVKGHRVRHPGYHVSLSLTLSDSSYLETIYLLFSAVFFWTGHMNLTLIPAI